MKKKGLIVLLIIISLFIITGCDKKKEKEKKKEIVTTTELYMPTAEGDITFTYPKQRSFSIKVKEEELSNGEVAIKTTLYSNDLAIGIDAGAMTVSYTGFENGISALKKQKECEELKLKNFEGYIRDITSKSLSYDIIIEKNKEADDALVISGQAYFINTPEETGEKPNIKKAFTSTIITDFFDSMKIEKED